MTNRQSVEVLNEADSMERRLDWILFKSEQEQQLVWREGEWNVGDEIWNRPSWWMSSRQYIRPIIQSLDINMYSSFGEELIVRCTDCEVDWIGPEPCFVCGLTSPDMELTKQLPRRIWSYGFTPGFIDFSAESVHRYQNFEVSIPASFEPELLFDRYQLGDEVVDFNPTVGIEPTWVVPDDWDANISAEVSIPRVSVGDVRPDTRDFDGYWVRYELEFGSLRRRRDG